MNGKVALSIIIPVFNGERFIARALSSILSQPSEDYEIIVVNDGSTDNSLEVIGKFEKQYKNIRVINNTNHGVCYTRNVGLKHATGEYILFFDQDDVFFENSYDLDLSSRLHDYYLDNVDIFCFRYVKSNNTIQRFSTMKTIPQSGQDNKVYMVSGLPTHFAIYNERLFNDNNLRFMESKYIDLDMQLTHLLFYYSKK